MQGSHATDSCDAGTSIGVQRVPYQRTTAPTCLVIRSASTARNLPTDPPRATPCWCLRTLLVLHQFVASLALALARSCPGQRAPRRGAAADGGPMACATHPAPMGSHGGSAWGVACCSGACSAALHRFTAAALHLCTRRSPCPATRAPPARWLPPRTDVGHRRRSLPSGNEARPCAPGVADLRSRVCIACIPDSGTAFVSEALNPSWDRPAQHSLVRGDPVSGPDPASTCPQVGSVQLR